MASIEFITKRIEGKEKELEKLNKKLARIRKVESQNWKDPNPYHYSEYDLKCTLNDIEVAQKALDGYKAQLVTETEKANSRNIEVIVKFLESWKIRNLEFYESKFPEYLEALSEYHQKNREHCDWYNNGGHRQDSNWKEIEKEYDEYRKSFSTRWMFMTPYVDRVQNRTTYKYDYVFNTEKLKKDLDQEANRKYDFIIERTNGIVGQITDASQLRVGNKGDLNGFIIGTKGIAKVQTIGAGGYNIQCFHFRTLIDSVK